MSTVVSRAGRLAILAFFAGMLVMLTPATAHAHGGAHHDSAPEQAHPHSSPIGVFSAAEARATDCPDGPGHVCSCGNLALCTNPGDPLVPISQRWSVSFTPPGATALAVFHGAVPFPSRFFPSSPPRAPPLIS